MRAALLTAVTVFVVGCGGGGGKNGGGILDGKPSDAVLDDVLKAYSANPAAADEKYKDKVLKVVALSVVMERDGDVTTAVYRPIGHIAPARGARFYFTNEAEAAKLRPGPSYTITGTCAGITGNAVMFRDCTAAENPAPAPVPVKGAGKYKE